MNQETLSRAPQGAAGLIDGVLLAFRNARDGRLPGLAAAKQRAWPYAKPVAWVIGGAVYLAAAFVAAVWVVF